MVCNDKAQVMLERGLDVINLQIVLRKHLDLFINCLTSVRILSFKNLRTRRTDA
jgi:hypothetical protein